MPAKRKLDTFDPNKSDSNDTDFDPSEAAPRKSAKKSRKTTKHSSTGGRKKRARYGGSDVDEDDVDDSLAELSFDEASEEEEVEMNEATGRAVRKATKNTVSYIEDSNSDADQILGDIEDEDDDDSDRPKKRTTGRKSRAPAIDADEEDEEGDDELREVPKTSQRTKVVVLKLNTPLQTRSTRAGSAARITRARGSTEPKSAGLPPRRNTRAHTEDNEPEISLSNSGKHVVRDGQSAEPVGRPRSRGSKGLLLASTIKEEIHETSSYEQPDEPEATAPIEIPGTDEREEAMEKSDAPDEAAEHSTPDGTPEKVADQVVVGMADDDDDDDDDIPVGRMTRARSSRRASLAEASAEPVEQTTATRTSGRLTRGSKSKQKKTGAEASSDFEPNEEASDEEISASDTSPKKAKSRDDGYASSRGRARPQAKSKSSSRRRNSAGSDIEEIDQDELAEELSELQKGGRKKRPRAESQIAYERPGRKRKTIDYSIRPMADIYAQDEEAQEASATPTRRGKSGRATQAWERPFFSALGPFGGAGGLAPVIGGPWGTGATGGVDSDSSDDDTMQRPTNVNVGMTPTSALPAGLLPGLGQTNNAEPLGMGGTPNVGKIKSQKALADADPLGVDQNVDFSKIGGLEGHIDQLKEMVQMPLLYPELFLKFHVTPPRGVLFHGPPGTGKTLLARALAASIGSGGRKITFYMRKGADALSKWVGEAERQLRLLFEEARKTQPSIIFFDEIDGLAPVRSSKQEQIHASIVSTLLALMDGMDGRGQVIVIGATNRPDNIDPALRRPGRFDREFYFPLPDVEARKSIINIHTKDWGIDDGFKTSLAHVTKGYGGADLRALCTEAALNSIQRTYPQIYSSNDKLLVDADKIKVTAKDFMLSVKKMIPSSERSTSSGAVPLPKAVAPLLQTQLKEIETVLDGLIPIKKKTTALQEAMFEQFDDEDQGFGRETLQQEFEKSRVFRPRLLICGEPGYGQAYLGGAILNHFEGLHVQSFDLPTIYSDSTRSAEAAIVQLFAEVKRHKPSVIYLPGIETWYHTLSEAVITTFLGLLKAIPPTDPVLVLGISDLPLKGLNSDLLRDFFGFSKTNRFIIKRPNQENRSEFFEPIVSYARKEPKDFPEPLNRKKRVLEVLPLAPIPPPIPPTKEEIKALMKRDHQLLNLLKIQIQPIMDQIQKKYRRFRTPAIPLNQIQYLIDEQDPGHVRPDIPQSRPFELSKDKDGVSGIRETVSGKFFYNLETTTIEERLSNGFYARPSDFVADIRSLAKDSKNLGEKARTLQANELLANVEVDLATIEANPLYADCENVYRRQLQRAKEREEKQKKRAGADVFGPGLQSDVAGSEEAGPLILGAAIPGLRSIPLLTPLHGSSNLSNGFSASDEHMSNGTSAPIEGDIPIVGDIAMSGTDDIPSQHSPMHPPNLIRSVASGPSALGSKPNTQVSQLSAWQEISHGTSPSQMINYASTTTSGKRTSEGWSTQATNGIGNQTTSSPLEKYNADSDLPDTRQNTQNTQETQDTSSEEWLHSQAQGLARGQLQNSNPSQTTSSESQISQNPANRPYPAPPRVTPATTSRPSGFANLLNESPVEPVSHTTSEEEVAALALFERTVANFKTRLIHGSSGCNVEQLEQVNRQLMDTLWHLRGDSNRNHVVLTLTKVFNETIQDIEEMQNVAEASQPGQFHTNIIR